MALPLVYHWRNLLVRKTTSILNILVVSAVVAVFCWMLSFSQSLQRSLSLSTSDHKIIIIRRGATSEFNSAINVEDANKLTQVVGLAHDPKTGEALICPQMVVQVSLPRLADGGKTNANVAVRGVTEQALKIHKNVQLLGPMFSTQEPEVIVGLKASQQFSGLQVGQSVNLGYGDNRAYKVVGYFSADGGPLESEIWGYLPSLNNAYNRSQYSSVNLLLDESADPLAALDQINGPSIQLNGATESEYWEKQSERIQQYLGIATMLVLVMSLAAVLSIANTLFAMVSGRTREIAMLRTIGFSGGQVLSGFMIESVLLSLAGGVVGCVLCAAYFAIVGSTKDMYGATSFTTMAFDIKVTPLIVVFALVAVSVVGVIGSLIPAWRAARVQIITALREG